MIPSIEECYLFMDRYRMLTHIKAHSIVVARIARMIARGLRDVNPDISVSKTTAGALLHDIGKIDVAYNEILRQKGPLTPEQRQLIRDHPARGVDIVRSIRSIPGDVLACIRHHHERWDGNGYPDGLSGDEIPVGARIIMVCDTIDAMTTARPYRDPLPTSVVREELIKHAGGQFDKTIVDVVLHSGILEKLVDHSPGNGARTVAVPSPAVEALPENRSS